MGSDTAQAAPGSQSPLVLRDVRKRFTGLQVLNGVNLEVAKGEVVGLLGPNGAGKSTVLRIIAGTVEPDSGEVIVAGHHMEREPVVARRYVSWALGDEHGWYWRLSGFENLAFFGMLRGMTLSTARLRSAELLEAHGLADVARKRVGDYSTGMRARLSLARAGLMPTPLLILDEPSRGLDPAASEQLVEFLQSRAATATVLVTHDLDMVSRVAHRSLVLREGRVSHQVPCEASPDELAAAIIPAVTP